MNNELRHHGTPHEGAIPHSGRYAWGSGETPNQHGTESLSQAYERLRKDGYSEVDAAKELGYSTGKLRDLISLEKGREKAAQRARVQRLKEHGYSPAAIAEMTNIPERTVYNWINENETERVNKTQRVADNLKKLVDEKEYLDVGTGAEYLLDTNSTNLHKALTLLEKDGYSVQTIKTKNVTDPSKFTNVKVLCKPGTTWGYIQNNQDLVKPITEYTLDGSKNIAAVQYPSSISSSRVAIRYAEDGGKDYDGVMLIRRGVQDLSLGKSNYAQVRIAVDGTHYLKGMAMYADDQDLPKGVDILFNTNKHQGTPMLGPKDNSVLKPLKNNENLPFGAVITAKGQNYYEDANGKYVKDGGIFVLADKKTPKDAPRYSLSPINKLKEEGEWNEYSKTLSSQFLAKQSYALIKKQLDLSFAEKKSEFDEIMALTQPEIKKQLLKEFSADCDKAAVDLKAASLPGQTNKVILPLTCIRDEQIYAPGYSNGTQVALIRYPHAGLFEIPILTVNNNNKEARRIIGTTPIDAVGITSKVAAKLSGADFDGDTVVVIPLSDKVQIKSQDSLFKDFDPSEAFPKYPGMKVMTSREKGLEMGLISNLITDMTLQGATPQELTRAVKHSMVVIDAEKHELNWKLSEEVNGIAALKKEYQNKGDHYGGAATLISKASGSISVPERKQFNINQHVDPKTGEIKYELTNREYLKADIKDRETNKRKTVAVYKDKDNGYFYYERDSQNKTQKVPISEDKVKTVKAMQASTKMAETKDAYTLSSGTKKEAAYADYANSLKALANEARLGYLNTGSTKVNQSAKETYAKEIESLKAKVELAVLNSPKERQAQLIANQKIKNLMKSDEYLSSEDLKKARQQAISAARAQVGANKKDVQIDISDREWEAIQNGALSSSFINQILMNTKSEIIKERATPRDSMEISDAKKELIRSRAKSGFTIDEIAKSIGVSPSTVSKYVKE